MANNWLCQLLSCHEALWSQENQRLLATRGPYLKKASASAKSRSMASLWSVVPNANSLESSQRAG
eukprot:446046-Lingulodinium_polyedra.AAC.1